MYRVPATTNVIVASICLSKTCARISMAALCRTSSIGTAGIRERRMRPQAAALKELLDRPELRVMPGCGDAIGARLDLLTFPEMADAVETCIAAAPNVLWWPMATPDTATRWRCSR